MKKEEKYGIGKRFQTRQEEWFTIISKDEKDKYRRIIKFDDCDGEYSVEISSINKQKIAHPTRKIKKEKHGDRYTKLWKEWNAMLWRCNPKNKRHHVWYSDKGITVCEEWHSYLSFKEWALNNGYKDGLTIDRIDSNMNYCPQNCQWITLAENISKASVRAVVAIDLLNNKTQFFQSVKDTAQYFECSEETIRKKLKGKSIKRVPSLNDNILLFYADEKFNA